MSKPIDITKPCTTPTTAECEALAERLEEQIIADAFARKEIMCTSLARRLICERIAAAKALRAVAADRDAARAEVGRLTAALQVRSKQIGVACLKHDLTHSLACGHCAAESRAEVAELRGLLRRVLSCGLCEEPAGSGFTPSKQQIKAGELARDIAAALRRDKT